LPATGCSWKIQANFLVCAAAAADTATISYTAGVSGLEQTEQDLEEDGVLEPTKGVGVFFHHQSVFV
jgi:hypothetical protein